MSSIELLMLLYISWSRTATNEYFGYRLYCQLFCLQKLNIFNLEFKIEQIPKQQSSRSPKQQIPNCESGTRERFVFLL